MTRLRMIRPGTPERFMMRAPRISILSLAFYYFNVEKKDEGWIEVGFLGFWKHVALWRRAKRDK